MTDARELINDVWEEFFRARAKFPGANTNTLALCEEHGELVKAVVDFPQGKAALTDVRKELVQTMAMCLRLYFEGDQSVGLPPIVEVG